MKILPYCSCPYTYGLLKLYRAKSDPQGPVYLWARREIMEQELDPAEFSVPLENQKWAPIERSPLSSSGEYLPSLITICAV